MKKTLATSIFVLVFLVGISVLLRNKPASNYVQNNSLESDSKQTWESKIDEQASVTVTATPSDLGTESREWKFDILMSTHSVELDQDMTKVAILIDDFGKEYSPVRWEGAPEGGHHREGVLIFNQVVPIPKFIELKIFGIGDVVRSFIW